MRRASLIAAIPIAAALVAAGCGSSGYSTGGAGSGSSSGSTPAQTMSVPAGATPTTTPALVTTKQNKLGTILAAGPKRLTVYLFAADTASNSTCAGACAAAWPPVTTSGVPRATGQAAASDLGTITRPDGTMQVTYKHHPLYYFVKDGDAGDAYGQGVTAFGAAWYVLAPSGNQVNTTAAAGKTTTTTGTMARPGY